MTTNEDLSEIFLLFKEAKSIEDSVTMLKKN